MASRTGDTARRAVRRGVLQVDLVSLRRDRGRALADLGRRALRLWSEGRPAALESDAEALRLRALVNSIDTAVAAKEAEAAALRQSRTDEAPAEPHEIVGPD